MKTVLLMRHAKSSWDEPGVPDHDRPLNSRGKRDAPRVGRLLKEQGLRLDQIVSSTAKRARKTAQKVAEACEFAGEIALTDQLYLAAPQAYVHYLQGLTDDCQTVLVVGHNPGLEGLLDLLTGRYEPLPTAALAHVAFDIDSWHELSPQRPGSLLNLWRPKELDSADGA
jgi:phosphohistidine phosphatase